MAPRIAIAAPAPDLYAHLRQLLWKRLEREQMRLYGKVAVLEMQLAYARHQCVRCKESVENYEQVGRCVYASPCGHRQWQGTLGAGSSA